MTSLVKRYSLYLLRWQLSTPILALALILFASLGKVWATVLANLIGGLIFFWVDRFIFINPCFGNVWDIEENVTCADCGKVTRGYRLVCSPSLRYDKRKDQMPEYRCEECSKKKMEEVRRRGRG